MEILTENNVRIPKGINVTGSANTAGAEIKDYTGMKAQDGLKSPEQQMPWSYLFIHNKKVSAFTDRLRKDGMTFFIHKGIIYKRKKDSRGIIAIEKPSVSGLVFLQGSSNALQNYLDIEFPTSHLVNDCSTHRPAVIPHSQMIPFMRLMDTSPERIRFLLHPFKYYADGNTKIRITSGFLSGLEGYVVRIDRDRRLIINAGGMSVAISGIHCETFEVVAESS